MAFPVPLQQFLGSLNNKNQSSLLSLPYSFSFQLLVAILSLRGNTDKRGAHQPSSLSPLTPQPAASLLPTGTADLCTAVLFSEMHQRKRKCHNRVFRFWIVRQQPTGSSSQPETGQGYPVAYSRKPFTPSPQGEGCPAKWSASAQRRACGFFIWGSTPGTQPGLWSPSTSDFVLHQCFKTFPAW